MKPIPTTLPTPDETTSAGYWRDTVYNLYVHTIYSSNPTLVRQLSGEILQPFSISIATFLYRMGLKADLFKCIRVWLNTTHTKQVHVFVKLLGRLNRMPVWRLNQHNLNLRNRAIREVCQRIWHINRLKASHVFRKRLKARLESSGLGEYFAKMQSFGEGIQI